MWLFTQYGFFSIVSAKKLKNGNVSAELDPQTVLVRARDRRHLQNLQTRFADLRNLPVNQTSSDYACRLIVPKATWVQVARELAEEIDYDNFKDHCFGSGLTDDMYETALHETWLVHRNLQQARARQNFLDRMNDLEPRISSPEQADPHKKRAEGNPDAEA